MTTVTIDRNKEIAKAYFNAFSENRFDDALALTSDDFRLIGRGKSANFHNMSREETRSAFHAMKKIWTSPFKIIIDQMTAEEDRVAVQARSDAVLSDGFHYSNNYVFLVTIRSGKIVSIEEYACTLTVVNDVSSRRGGPIEAAASLLDETN